MSSVNPVFLLPGALARRGAELGRGLAVSATTNAGQLCTKPGLVFAVDGPGQQEFLVSIADAVHGQPALPLLNAATRRSYREGVRALQRHPSVTELASGSLNGDTVPTAVPAHVFITAADAWLSDPTLSEEVFGPATLVVVVPDPGMLSTIAEHLEGQLTATLHAEPTDADLAISLLPVLEEKAGRIIVNGWPTGVEVGPATVHGGPFPATSDGRTTSVGTLAIRRFLRPVAYQNLPSEYLPAVLPGRRKAVT
jgi:NADP-dependent aldehyde dehydrogenase